MIVTFNNSNSGLSKVNKGVKENVNVVCCDASVLLYKLYYSTNCV